MPTPEEQLAIVAVTPSATDRLINAAHHVTLEGKSYRPRQRPDAKNRSDGTSSGDVAENEVVRSPRTPATERANITTLGRKAVKTKTNPKTN